jgi:hypothetical protein
MDETGLSALFLLSFPVLYAQKVTVALLFRSQDLAGLCFFLVMFKK